MTDSSLSVVIATLGGECLSKTIDTLMNGTKVPDEILICIPADHAHKAEHLASAVVKVVATEVKGQVKQRAFGFTQVKKSLVLQSDDDLLFEKDTVQNLCNYLLQIGRGNAIAPVYYGQTTKRCIHELQAGFFKNIFDTVICGAPWGVKKMGVVTKLGLNYGVDDAYCTQELFQTQWLPGGCVLSFREELITKDFFPFTGKAYCEDIFHSYYRAQAGIISWVAKEIRVYIEEPVPEFNKAAVDKVIAIRRNFIRLSNGPKWRLSIYEWFSRIRGAIFTTGS